MNKLHPSSAMNKAGENSGIIKNRRLLAQRLQQLSRRAEKKLMLKQQLMRREETLDNIEWLFAKKLLDPIGYGVAKKHYVLLMQWQGLGSNWVKETSWLRERKRTQDLKVSRLAALNKLIGIRKVLGDENANLLEKLCLVRCRNYYEGERLVKRVSPILKLLERAKSQVV